MYTVWIIKGKFCLTVWNPCNSDHTCPACIIPLWNQGDPGIETLTFVFGPKTWLACRKRAMYHNATGTVREEVGYKCGKVNCKHRGGHTVTLGFKVCLQLWARGPIGTPQKRQEFKSPHGVRTNKLALNIKHVHMIESRMREFVVQYLLLVISELLIGSSYSNMQHAKLTSLWKLYNFQFSLHQMRISSVGRGTV